MTNQKLVLEQITALNTTTASIIDGTSKMLKDNSARIHEQAASSTIPMETLARAFQNIYDTMNAIDGRDRHLQAEDARHDDAHRHRDGGRGSQIEGLYRARRGREQG